MGASSSSGEAQFDDTLQGCALDAFPADFLFAYVLPSGGANRHRDWVTRCRTLYGRPDGHAWRLGNVVMAINGAGPPSLRGTARPCAATTLALDGLNRPNHRMAEWLETLPVCLPQLTTVWVTWSCAPEALDLVLKHPGVRRLGILDTEAVTHQVPENHQKRFGAVVARAVQQRRLTSLFLGESAHRHLSDIQDGLFGDIPLDSLYLMHAPVHPKMIPNVRTLVLHHISMQVETAQWLRLTKNRDRLCVRSLHPKQAFFSGRAPDSPDVGSPCR